MELIELEHGDPSRTEQIDLMRLEARARPFVLYRDPHGHQRILELPETSTRKPVTIGRGSWMDISLSWDDGVSRLHARLEPMGDDWTVIDDGTSANGTWLNGRRVAGRRRLSDGDELLVGSTRLRIGMPGRIDEASTVVFEADELPDARRRDQGPTGE